MYEGEKRAPRYPLEGEVRPLDFAAYLFAFQQFL
jgi:hypothetical protein